MWLRWKVCFVDNHNRRTENSRLSAYFYCFFLEEYLQWHNYKFLCVFITIQLKVFNLNKQLSSKLSEFNACFSHRSLTAKSNIPDVNTCSVYCLYCCKIKNQRSHCLVFPLKTTQLKTSNLKVSFSKKV